MTISKFAYRGYTIEITDCGPYGSQQVHNVKIDGKAATVCFFPNNNETLAKSLVDSRIAARNLS